LHPDQRQLRAQYHRDQFAGATGEEIEDPAPLAEIIRQWSSLHPEFVFLARKFKIAVGACEHDSRGAAVSRHGGPDREERPRPHRLQG